MASFLSESQLDSTVGCLFLAVVFTSTLWGVGCLQLYLYYEKFWKTDQHWLKGYIFLIWIFDTTHQALLLYSTYIPFVRGIANALLMIHLPATSKHILVISAFMDAMVQLIFVRRAWFLSNKNRILTGSLIPAVLSQFVVKLVFYGRIYHFTLAFQLFDVIHLELALNYIVAVADAYIAGILIWLLWKGRSGIKKTDSLINRLVLYTVSSSLVTAVWEVAAVIGAEVAPHSFIYLLADMVLPKLYLNCMLASLNARTSLRENLGNEVGVMSIRFQNVSMVSTEQSETRTITPHKAKDNRGLGLEGDIDVESGINRRRSDVGYEMSRRSFLDGSK
ncbi:hypothetical protein ACEPAG_2201 [Sanghuangporus baumii]